MNSPCALCGRTPVKARGLCLACYKRHLRRGGLDQFPTSRSWHRICEVLEDLDELLLVRVHPEHWPARLGIGPAALERALYRAGRPEQARLIARERYYGRL